MEPKGIKDAIDESVSIENDRLDNFMLELQKAQTAKEIINIKKDLTSVRCRLHAQKYYITEEDFPEASYNDLKITNSEHEEGFIYSIDLYKQLHKKCSDILDHADLLLESSGESVKNTNQYQELRDKLTSYISITTEDLKKLINGVGLQQGAAKWIGKPVDAYRFAYWLNPEESPRHKRFKAFFNNNVEGCKVHENQAGKDSDGDNRLKIGMHGTIWDILKQFRPTKEIDNNK